jgi:hypothetical protein
VVAGRALSPVVRTTRADRAAHACLRTARKSAESTLPRDGMAARFIDTQIGSTEALTLLFAIFPLTPLERHCSTVTSDVPFSLNCVSADIQRDKQKLSLVQWEHRPFE